MLGNVIEANILTGKGEGETVFIPRILLIPTDLPFRSSCFSHGQLYVACSRVSSPKNLFILAPGGETKNDIYNQVLS
jgi:hypothetical protein